MCQKALYCQFIIYTMYKKQSACSKLIHITSLTRSQSESPK